MCGRPLLRSISSKSWEQVKYSAWEQVKYSAWAQVKDSDLPVHYLTLSICLENFQYL